MVVCVTRQEWCNPENVNENTNLAMRIPMLKTIHAVAKQIGFDGLPCRLGAVGS